MEKRFGRRQLLRAGAGGLVAGLPLIGTSSLARATTPTPENRNVSNVSVSNVNTGTNRTLKMAFIYVDPVGDAGWTWAHDQGRKFAEQHVLGLETAYSEKVPEGSDAERVLRDYAQKGYGCIVATSFGYMDPTINVAKQFPKTQFIHISGYKRADNVSTAFGKIEEPRFVAGMVAAHMSKKGKLGYVAAFPIPEVIRGCNAFHLGARSVDPSIETQVVWTNTWYDPQEERQAAQALLDQGCDVIGQHQDSAAAQQAAQAAGKYGVGYDSDMSALAPKAVLTCPIWHWGVYYQMVAEKMLAGTWKGGEDYWGGWPEGLVDLSPFGQMVTADAVTQANGAIAKFKGGQLDVFDVFAGPLKDQTGKERVPAGQKMEHDAIWGMNWFVQGVSGKIPS